MKTTGLTLAEAVKSGRPFRHSKWTPGDVLCGNTSCDCIMVKEAISSEWEIEPPPPKQTWTREEVEAIKYKIFQEVIEGTHRYKQITEAFKDAGL
jgi:hypothetical protein